jgi:hypothetical protein
MSIQDQKVCQIEAKPTWHHFDGKINLSSHFIPFLELGVNFALIKLKLKIHVEYKVTPYWGHSNMLRYLSKVNYYYILKYLGPCVNYYSISMGWLLDVFLRALRKSCMVTILHNSIKAP